MTVNSISNNASAQIPNKKVTITIGASNTANTSTSIWKGLQRMGYSESDILKIHRYMNIDPDGDARHIADGTTIDVTAAIEKLNPPKQQSAQNITQTSTDDNKNTAAPATTPQETPQAAASIVSDNTGGEKLSPLAQKYKDWLKANAKDAYNPQNGLNENFDFSDGIYVDGKKGPDTYKAAIKNFTKARMEVIDTNKDGTISKEELSNFELQNANYIKDEDMRKAKVYSLTKKENAQKRFDGLDYNGDGKIDFEELMAETIYLDTAQNLNNPSEWQISCKFSPYDIFKKRETGKVQDQRNIINTVFKEHFERNIGE